MTGRDASIDRALRAFAAAVTAKTARVPAGAPEERLRGPFEILMAEAAGALGWEVVCAGETALSDRFGRPDFAVHGNGLLVGYVELKAPGKGADAARFKPPRTCASCSGFWGRRWRPSPPRRGNRPTPAPAPPLL